MPTYKFSGRVLPLFNDFRVSTPVTANWNDPINPPISLAMTATLTIDNGIIDILCASNLSGTDDYDGQVYLRALDLASAVVSTYAFGKGIGLSVVLESVIKPDGIKYNIQERRPQLEALVTALHSRQDGGIDITAILPIILSDPTIFVALTDLIGSINHTKEAPVKCGRAVDAIRHYMAPQNDRKAGWPAMRSSLNLGQSFLEFITESSKGPRHGDVKGGTFSNVEEIIRRAWIVMDRFLEFKKRGDQPLAITDFPLLDR